MSDVRPSQAGDKTVLARVSERFERALLDLQAQSIEAGTGGRSPTVEDAAETARAG
jgi:hypothetical protein